MDARSPGKSELLERFNDGLLRSKTRRESDRGEVYVNSVLRRVGRYVTRPTSGISGFPFIASKSFVHRASLRFIFYFIFRRMSQSENTLELSDLSLSCSKRSSRISVCKEWSVTESGQRVRYFVNEGIFNDNLLVVPSFILSPLLESRPPVFDRVFLHVLLSSSMIVATLSLDSRNNVRTAEVDLQPLVYSSLDLSLRTPRTTGCLFSQSITKMKIYLQLNDMCIN